MNSKSIDFIGIGAQKSGTSWLYKNLLQLPDFTLPPIKEIHYFDRHPKYPSPSHLHATSFWGRLPDNYWTTTSFGKMAKALIRFDFETFGWMMNWTFSNYNDDWYLSLFEQLPGIRGEISPSYSMLEVEDIQAMYRLAPDAKLVLLLRNPIDRAWSHYRFSKRREKNYAFNEPFESIKAFIDSDKQERRSDYWTTLQRYGSVYPSNQILVGFYDAIKAQPTELLSSIVEFMGGKPDNIKKHCDLSQRIHASKSVDCPEEVLEYLKEKYRQPIDQLAANYGHYFNYWKTTSYHPEDAESKRPSAPTFLLSDV